jgi:hypothetical protein
MKYFRWQQCFLAGINHMLLGFRNDYGIVECLQPLSVKDIEIRAVNIFISFHNSIFLILENMEC